MGIYSPIHGPLDAPLYMGSIYSNNYLGYYTALELRKCMFRYDSERHHIVLNSILVFYQHVNCSVRIKCAVCAICLVFCSFVQYESMYLFVSHEICNFLLFCSFVDLQNCCSG